MMMVMMAAAADAVLVIVVLMVMLVLVLIVVLVVMMMAAAVVVVLIVVVMVMMVVLVLVLVGVGLVGGAGLGQQLSHQVALAVHDGNDLGTGQGGPIGGHDGSGGVLLGQHGDSGGDLLLAGVAGAAQDNAGGMADLVIIELAEVLHIHLDLVHIGHGDKAVQDDGQISATPSTARVTSDSLPTPEGSMRIRSGMVGLDDLLQGLAEVSHQAAADAAGVQLIDLDTGLTHEAAVDADLAELVLDQDDLLTLESFLDQLFDQGGLTGTQEAGENVDLGLSFSAIVGYLYSRCVQMFSWLAIYVH